MNAMVLAAGFGTRLGALTRELPKALVPVNGVPMIDHAIAALARLGCGRIVVNAHHHADALARHVAALDAGCELVVVREDTILGTGGGVLNARALLEGGGPFLVHNADIVTEFDLRRLVEAHAASGALATLALRPAPSSRPLAFDAAMTFLGKRAWCEEAGGVPADARLYGFTGIHMIDPAVFAMEFPGGFSDIFDIYREALGASRRITGLVFAEYWHDLGTPERIREFEAHLRVGEG